MLNSKNVNLQYLLRLGLSRDEAKVYLAVLDKPITHLEIARLTGINRTKVYRIAEDLEKQSLVVHESQSDGRFLKANDPKQLEINLVSKEEHLRAQKAVYERALPGLQEIYKNGLPEVTQFLVKTYDGIAGFKQMLWNELEANDEIYIFGNGTLEDLVVSKLWSEKHRQRTTEAGYVIKEIINPGHKPPDFTKNSTFISEHFVQRRISTKTLVITQQITIYNDTVATYHWKDQQKIGFEVINKAYAEMMKSVFLNYWNLAS